MGFLPVYLLEDLEYEKVVIGLFMSGAQVTGIVAQPLMGYLSDKFGRKIVLVPCTLAMGLLIISLRFAEPGLQLVTVVLVMGAFLYSLHTIYIAGAMDVAQGQAQSTVVSLIYGASFFGAFSPWVAGWVADQWGNSASFIFGGVLVILGGLILWATRLPKTASQMNAES